MTESAISAGVSPPRSSPMGAWRRSIKLSTCPSTLESAEWRLLPTAANNPPVPRSAGPPQRPEIGQIPAQKLAKNTRVLFETVRHQDGRVRRPQFQTRKFMRVDNMHVLRFREAGAGSQMRTAIGHRDIPSQLPRLLHQRNRVVPGAKDKQTRA